MIVLQSDERRHVTGFRDLLHSAVENQQLIANALLQPASRRTMSYRVSLKYT